MAESGALARRRAVWDKSSPAHQKYDFKKFKFLVYGTTYTAVLHQVDVSKPVYLTRNDRGTYAIAKIDDYDREATVETLVREIEKGERIASDTTVSITDIAQKLGVSL